MNKLAIAINIFKEDDVIKMLKMESEIYLVSSLRSIYDRVALKENLAGSLAVNQFKALAPMSSGEMTPQAYIDK